MFSLTKAVPVIYPASLKSIEVARSTREFLRQMQLESMSNAKIVLGVFAGRGVIAIGSERLPHVDILDQATQELCFSKRIVTTLDPNKTKAIPGALIQGAKLKIGCWTTPQIWIHDKSESFGSLYGKICGQSTLEATHKLVTEYVKLL